MTKPSLDLPFDQYSRQEIVRTIVDESTRKIITINRAEKKLRIVDFGGHKGHTQDFFPNDHVTILDVFDETYPNYVKGDATKTPFEDGKFDVVVSFDTLEHIPPARRADFIKEASRVAKYAAFIAAPFDNESGDVILAEKIANRLYKKVNGVDHPWLAEHIEYGIPTKQDTQNQILATGLQFANIPTNDLVVWLLTQNLMFNATAINGDIKEVVDVSRYYNLNLSKLESAVTDAYRQIYVCSKNADIINGVEVWHKSIPRLNHIQTHAAYIDVIDQAYAAIIHQLKGDVEYLKSRETHLQTKYNEAAIDADKLRAELAGILNKLSETENSQN